MIFIDASFFLAYDNSNDVHHNRAEELWKEIESQKWGVYFTSDYVFNEVVGVAMRKFGKSRAMILGKQILDTVFIINIDDHLLRDAWKLFTNTELQLSLVDCSNVVASRIGEAGYIATFDKEFEKIKEIKTVK